MQPTTILKLLFSSVSFAILATSCGSYQHVTDSNSQSVPNLASYPKVSGKPALRVPAKMGILTTSRFTGTSLNAEEIRKMQAPGIRTILTVNPYVSDNRHSWTLSDLLQQRAKIIQETRFLDLDVILLCDESRNTETRQYSESLQILTLGILNPESTKTQTQLDAALMDARTGFIYGVIGDEGNGTTHSATFLEADALKKAGEKRATGTARKQLVDRFPSFWQSVTNRYHR